MLYIQLILLDLDVKMVTKMMYNAIAGWGGARLEPPPSAII